MRSIPILAAVIIATGCGDPAKKERTREEELPPPKGAAAKAAVADTSGAPGLPGPPSATPPPASSDPATRAVEDRLFRSDGGKVVLRAIRSHGGWESWSRVREVSAVVRPLPPAVPPVTGASPAVSASPAPSPPAPGAPAAAEPRRIDVPVPAPDAIPATREGKLLTAPFWYANSAVRLEYLGVEAVPEGTIYDKVRVFQETPGSSWEVAYFDRHTGILSRVLWPAAAERPEFKRMDLGSPHQVEGIWLPTRWTEHHLPSRFARAELDHPARVEALDPEVALR